MRFWTQIVLITAAALVLGFPLNPARAQENSSSAQIAWRLLDYIAVDYSGAIADGRVISAAEYSEMQEFSTSVRERLAALPPSSEKARLLSQADTLIAAINAKASPTHVADQAHRLAGALLTAYPMPLAPSSAPDLARGAALYQEQCASCHGVTGHADGSAASGLDPPPIAFTDMERARQRSPFGLYQVIGQGLDGTAMASFAHLTEQDRWALAFYVSSIAFDDDAVTRGQRLWSSDPSVRAQITNLQALAQTSPAALSTTLGEPRATQLMAYLRKHPEALTAGDAPLAVARARLAQSLEHYEAGEKDEALELALSAYLDGFEQVEPSLAANDSALLQRVESAMGALRASISATAPTTDVRAQIERLNALFDAAERALAPQNANPGASFAGAFTILLREGVEALLIVIAMIAFLGKADRRDVLPYVHGGWISALAAGVVTWAVATSLITISGASRELTEGFGSLVSAVVLISVGIWMHGKSQADAWQVYIREKLSHTLSKGSAWFLFLLAFVVVYREVFETILFYVALWSQGAHGAILAGAGAAVLALAVIAWALLSYSKRLPISQFFAYSSLLIAALSIVLVGKGVAALQEAGMLDIHPLAPIPQIEFLGIYSAWESVSAQILTLAVIVVGFTLNQPRVRMAPPS